MNKIVLEITVAALCFVAMPPATAAATEQGGQSSEELDFQRIDFFSISDIGFAPHKSEEHMLFEAVLKNKNAEAIFRKSIDDANGKPAAQLYSLCGLKLLSSPAYKSAKIKLMASHETVTTMTGDVLRKEEVGDIARRIARSECKKF